MTHSTPMASAIPAIDYYRDVDWQGQYHRQAEIGYSSYPNNYNGFLPMPHIQLRLRFSNN